jgi:hypothetical protein
VQIEPIRVHPGFALAHLIHAAVGIAGSVLSVSQPLAGTALVLLAAVSAFGDLTGSFFLARRLTGARASQNIASFDDSGKPGTLILTAPYDAPRSGALFRLRLWPMVFFWSLMAILVCATARLFGVDGTWLTAIQFVPTVALIAAVPLFAEVALSDVGAGEAEASGVAAVLRLAAGYGDTLEHFDLAVLLTGADHPVPLGSRAWLRSHRFDLAGESTVVICIDGGGGEALRYATKEGLVFPARFHPTLTAICAELEGAEPYVSRELSGAHAARSAGLPAIRVSSGYERLCDLIERVDSEVGPRLPE